MSGTAGKGMADVACGLCGSERRSRFLVAEDDLTGRPGRFTFVRCADCGFAYQSPRLCVEEVKAYYGDEYIAHRKKRDWGPLKRFVDGALDRLDRDKLALVERYAPLAAGRQVLDVGCGAGTFLAKVRSARGAAVAGVDFIDLRHLPPLVGVEFHCGLFYDVDVGCDRFDLISMWHFLEHDYDPGRSLRRAGTALKPGGLLVIEVPRLDSLSFRLYGDRWPGLQAPQHTVLYTKETLLRQVRLAGLEVVDHLPYGAYPAYFYLFAGAAFRVRKGRGLDLGKVVLPYLLGQVLLAPVLLFEKSLNLSMQTVVCRRPS